jgi:DNA helicase-2/ATP-dependent DNA helicase PcrA
MNAEVILEGLNEQQIEAVRHVDGPLLVVAGAGSGKTRVITRRVAHLISQGIEPQAIVAITFTNKAADEMLARVNTLLERYNGQDVRRPVIATFHAFSAQLLRIYGRSIGIDPNYSIFDTVDRQKLIKMASGDVNALPFGLTAAKIADLIERAKRQRILPDQIEQLDDLPQYLRPAVARIYNRYQQLLVENNGLDFDDLLGKALELLESDEAGASIRRRYHYLLIDEYQDTNRVQYLLARSLARNSSNICATGDPDQSIYGWRGADLRNILEFQEDFPNAKVVFLEKNYRSTGHILQAADSLIRHNVERKEKSLVPVHEQGEPIEVHECDDEVQEAAKILEIVSEYRREGIPLGEIAVFSRVNSLLRTVEQALISADIPYELARGVGFFQRKEIKDLVAYLRVLANPDDQLSLERIINVPARGIGLQAQTLLKAYADQKRISLLQAVSQADQIAELGKSQNSVIQFGSLMTQLAAINNESNLTTIVRQTIDLTGLRSCYQKAAEKQNRADELSPVANLDEFVSTAQVYESHISPEEQSLPHFLSQVSLVSEIDSVKGQADRLTLLTIHAAKGLEFSVVIVIAAEEDIMPHALAMPNGLEEERRLFFVALTRAKRRLHVCYANRRSTRGSYRRSMPSRFLKEIDPKSVRGLTLSTFARPARNFQFVINARRPTPAEPQPALQMPRCPYRTGQRIYHEKFGYGLIEEIHLSGNHYTGSIRFHGAAGLKKIVLNIAPLHAVKED